MGLIDITVFDTYGWHGAIIGMRNSRKSWEKSDSLFIDIGKGTFLGPNDLELASKLAKAGGSHAKFRRMIHAQMDICAPFYWWKEFDTYKIGTVANSTSTMYSIADKKFDISDFAIHNGMSGPGGMHMLKTIDILNEIRDLYLEEENRLLKKMYWEDMIQLLPGNYKQLRTVDLNYEVLAHICGERKGHKLQEWAEFIRVVREQMPFAEELIFCEEE